MLTETQYNALVLITEALDAASIPYQLTGGIAAIAHGAHRPLYDIDIDIYERDVEQVRALFSDYIVEDWNNELEGDEDLFDIWMMTLSVFGVSVDISQIEGARLRVLGGPWIPQPNTLNYEMREVAGRMLPVQSKESLIAYKTLIARDTDLEDIAQMS